MARTAEIACLYLMFHELIVKCLARQAQLPARSFGASATLAQSILEHQFFESGNTIFQGPGAPGRDRSAGSIPQMEPKDVIASKGPQFVQVARPVMTHQVMPAAFVERASGSLELALE